MQLRVKDLASGNGLLCHSTNTIHYLSPYWLIIINILNNTLQSISCWCTLDINHKNILQIMSSKWPPLPEGLISSIVNPFKCGMLFAVTWATCDGCTTNICSLAFIAMRHSSHVWFHRLLLFRVKYLTRLHYYNNLSLTHWGQGRHICNSKLIIIGSDNSLSPGWHQAIYHTVFEKKLKWIFKILIPQIFYWYCCAHTNNILEWLDKNWASLFDLKRSWQTTDNIGIGIR